ncbi:elongation factor G [Puniceicoccales bacterium CK1056]|uniref:Elongation factor G n=1 Tax=Oceanipulchritudo coccoides TaxID=2706888 RepID=A0A6B2LYG1_9BACT|nr:elongation factor G [Oceanipulchritudo coccoides]NDV61182.1 elongation factor G [Oceanipulchritudo coccoides]
MKTYTPENIRNFAVVGHQASGKTMLTEAMLRCAGAIQRLGSVEAGTTVSDYHDSEKERQISVHASLLHCDWTDKKFNIIDTPGYLDFISEGLGALRVGDFALVVANAANGAELGTDQVWEYATGYGIPKMIVVNGADRENIDFDAILEDLRAHFGSNVFPMTLPINPGPGFNQVLDVMRSEEIDYATDASGAYTEKKAEGQWADRVKELHRELIEFVAEADDSLLEIFFEQGSLSEEQFRKGVHAAIQAQSFIPVFVTSATHNVGVARLMDFIAKYGSSPLDRKTVPAMNENDEPLEISLSDKEAACYIFKTISEAHVGELSFCRLYSGEIRQGMEMFNTDRNCTEKIGQIYTLMGHNRENIDRIGPGDIGVMVKLKDTHTGNTLSSPGRKVKLPAVEYPKPNIHGALEVAVKGDEDKLAEGLATLHEEDPTFLYVNNKETAELVLSGQGELHLEVIKGRLKRRFNVEILLKEPKVPFRETIRKKAESKYRHKKQSGGAGQFAEVWMRIEPLSRDAGIDFGHSLVGQNVDRVFVPSVEKGVQSACQEGILAHCHVSDIKIDFYDGKMHPVDSKDIAFQIAGKEAFKQAFKEASPCLLEPIMNVQIKIPEDFMGDVMGDISSRRGRIQGMDTDGKFQVINASVPMMELYRYSTSLRSLTGGRGFHSESFSHYEEMPRDLEKKTIERLNAD